MTEDAEESGEAIRGPVDASQIPRYADLPVAGADVVEVSPAYDHAEITSVAAAHVCFELLALLLLGKQ